MLILSEREYLNALRKVTNKQYLLVIDINQKERHFSVSLFSKYTLRDSNPGPID